VLARSRKCAQSRRRCAMNRRGDAAKLVEIAVTWAPAFPAMLPTGNHRSGAEMSIVVISWSMRRRHRGRVRQYSRANAWWKGARSLVKDLPATGADRLSCATGHNCSRKPDSPLSHRERFTYGVLGSQVLPEAGRNTGSDASFIIHPGPGAAIPMKPYDYVIVGAGSAGGHAGEPPVARSRHQGLPD